MIPYQFVTLRYVHSVSSGEFVNIGLLMWLPEKQEIIYVITNRHGRVAEFFQPFDATGYRQMIHRMRGRFHRAEKQLNQHAQLNFFHKRPQSIDEVLHTLIPEDSSCFQWSPIMAGAVSDPKARFQHLVIEFVELHQPYHPRERDTEERILRILNNQIRSHGLDDLVERDVPIQSNNYSFQFKIGWNNAVPQVLEPISFDYLDGHDVVEKAIMWSGRLANLAKTNTFKMTGVIAPPQKGAWQHEFKNALAILTEAPCIRQLITHNEFGEFIPKIKQDIATNKQ